MAFGLARSNSGPPGLSINIGSANSPFGSSSTPQQQPPQASLFGQSQSNMSGGLFGAKPAATSGGLFGSTTTSTPAAGGGLFGNTQSSTPASGGLFGAKPAATTGGGLFGGGATSTQPATGGGLFGNTQTQQPATGGGLFGNTQTQTQQPATTGGGLFGSTTTQQPASGGLFGGGAAKPSLFGATTTQQPASGGLFGGGAQQQQQQTNTFGQTLGGLQMGQSQAPAQQQSVPAVRIDQSNIRITTRYNDLHETLQKEIEQMDDMITSVIKRATECAAILPAHGDQLELIPDNVEFLQRKYIGVSANLDADVQTVSQVGRQVRVDAENAKLSFDAVENLKLPVQYHQGMWNTTKPTSPSGKSGEEAKDIVGLFDQTADEMSKTYKNNVAKMDEIEQYLRGLEGQIMRAGANIGGRGQESDDTQLVVGALRDFENGIMNVANHVGDAREKLNQLQQGPVFESRANDNGKRRGVY